MHKSVLLFILLLTSLEAKDIRPSFSLHVQGVVNDFLFEDGKLYVATDRGSVDIFDLQTKRLMHQVVLEPLRIGSGELVPASISSVSVFI